VSSFTTYLSNRVLDHVTGKASFTMPTVYVALFTTNPTDAGGGTEAAYTGYARVTTSAATWANAASNATSNAAAIAFPACTAGSSAVTGFGAYDAASGGNLLWYGTCSLAVSTGVTPEFPIGELDVSLT
jgi:hypothetical protein